MSHSPDLSALTGAFAGFTLIETLYATVVLIMIAINFAIWLSVFLDWRDIKKKKTI